MHLFELIRANDVAQAIQGAAASPTAQQGALVRFVGGGTTLIDLMKLNVE
jgi:xanthine dehydrogenase YagS FAD-binding subunit